MNKTEKNAIKKIGKGALIVLIGYIIAKILVLARVTLFARLLGSEKYGVFSMAFTLITIVSIFCLMGFSQGVVNFIAKAKNKKIIKQIIKHSFLVVFFSSVVTSILIITLRKNIASFFNMPHLYYILIPFSLALPFIALFEVGNAVFEGFSLMKYRTIFKDFLLNLTIVILALVFFFFNFNLVKAAMSILIAYVFVFSVIFYTIYRRINFLKEETNTNLTKQIFNFSWPIMLSSVLYLLLHRIDIFFIGHFLDSSIVGKYSVSSDLSNVLGILNAIIIPIFFPVISKLVSGDKIKETGTIFRKTTKFLTIFTLPLLLVFVLFNNEIIFYIFGKEYAGSGIFLAILSFASFFACISGPIGMLLKAMNYPKLVLLNSIVALLINLVLNYLLITKFGAVGVAIATLVSIFTQNYLGILELWLIKKIKPYDFNLIRPVIMIMLIGICGFLIKNNLPPTIFYNMLVAGGIISLYGIYLLIDKKLINIKFYIQLAQGMMKNGKQK